MLASQVNKEKKGRGKKKDEFVLYCFQPPEVARLGLQLSGLYYCFSVQINNVSCDVTTWEDRWST